MDPNSSGRFRYLTTVHVQERSERPSPVSVDNEGAPVVQN